MELEIKLILTVIIIAVVAVATYMLLTQKKVDEFEIFSNLPTDNATVIMYINLNQNAFGEASTIVGSVLGGTYIKEIRGLQAGFVLSNYTTGAIIYVGTNTTPGDLLEQIRYTEGGMLPFQVTNETINGKLVTVISDYRNEINSICMWRDGEWLKILTTQRSVLPYLAASNMSGLLTVTSKEAEQCDDIMKSSYDTSYVHNLFSETEEFKNRINASGQYFGEIRVATKDINLNLFASLPTIPENFRNVFKKAVSSSGYAVFFGDDNADYTLSISHSNIPFQSLLVGTAGLPCYNYSTFLGGQISEIVKSGNEEGCFIQSTAELGPIKIESSSFTRLVGEYSVSASAYVKGDAGKVKAYLEDTVLSQSFQGNDMGWTDRMNLTIKVFEGSKLSALLNGTTSNKPLQGVNVSLYSYNATSLFSPQGPLIRTALTDSFGEADFNDLPDAIYYVEANKSGYTSDYSTASPSLAYAELYIQPRLPLEVKVTDEASGLPLGGARVDLYNETDLSSPISTSYTDSNGIASFGNITVDSGEVTVSKTGYDVRTSYIFQGATMPIEAGLFQTYGQTSPPVTSEITITWNTQPQVIAAGSSDGKVLIQIANTGNTTIRSVSASLGSKEIIVTALGSNFIGTLNVGDSTTIQPSISVPANLAQGEYSIPLNVTFVDGGNQVKTVEQNVTISVSG